MRNLRVYPVTFEEKITLLQDLRRQFATEGCVGDMRPLLLKDIEIDLRMLASLQQQTPQDITQAAI